MAPQTAFYLLQGLETLPVRMVRHVDNAREIVAFLDEAPEASWVVYPELDSHLDHDLAADLLPKGCGAIFSFGIRGGRDAGRRFIEHLQLFSHLANVGDAKSLVIHPASTTHATMSAEELEAAGVGEDLVRLSIGLEDPDDLIADLAQALRASQRG
jgi:O-acetylhomoserine (thiol)-lyase